MDYENDVMMETEEVEVDGNRDLSTIVGVGLIAGAGVVVYEGGKRLVKFAAPKGKAIWDKFRGKNKDVEEEPSADAGSDPPAEK